MSPRPQEDAAAALSRARQLAGWGVTRVPARRRPSARATESRAAQLERLKQAVLTCTRCPLHTTRTQGVFGDGDPEARLVFVGEAPGRDEDEQGIPFVGAAGQLLTKMIEAIGLKRQDVYICNVLKSRPPNNRPPLPEEIEACRPYLVEQLRILRPALICALGAVAAKALLGPHVAITQIRGQAREYEGIPVIPTFHPAYLLRNPDAKKDAWQDLKRVRKLLDERLAAEAGR
jgi:DNA polymerase